MSLFPPPKKVKYPFKRQRFQGLEFRFEEIKPCFVAKELQSYGAADLKNIYTFLL